MLTLEPPPSPCAQKWLAFLEDIRPDDDILISPVVTLVNGLRACPDGLSVLLGAAAQYARGPHANDERLATVVEALRDWGSDADRIVPVLVDLLDHTAVRVYAADALGKIGPAASAAVPALRRAAVAPDGMLAARALWALHAIDTARAVRYVRLLIRRAKDRPPHDTASQLAAVNALGILGAWPDRVVPVLATHLARHDVRSDRIYAVLHALEPFGPDAAPAVPVLLALLQRCEAAEAYPFSSVARALGRVGQGAEAAVPALIEAVTEADAFTEAEKRTEAAIWALGKIGDPAALPVLMKTIRQRQKRRAPYDFVFPMAILALGDLGIGSREVVAVLLDELGDRRNGRARWQAAEALGKLTPLGQATLDALIAALDDADPNVQCAAALALQQHGAAAALPALRRLAHGARDAHVRECMAEAVAAMEIKQRGPYR
ncbi:HEAT repeat domain-containing protein [Polyangium sp. 15x6]|uniref:HEAT repeat domain-containing protein n=1 Tax=Polyangium sp. 15x6 TaxID=3042687 RepID=UPI00249BE4BE|nr:HEAT repeat domain-containing protein [Polyangium sp. 15x6]MDI3282149.1 HEAT repeat domain-containing protein [Polyangium sp. 15x6]